MEEETNIAKEIALLRRVIAAKAIVEHGKENTMAHIYDRAERELSDALFDMQEEDVIA